MSSRSTAVGTKWAEVDVDALRHNTAAVKAHVGAACAVMAMVKADGYGHGATRTAAAALDGGATWLGVSSLREALELRAACIEAPILNVGWTMPAEMVDAAAAGIDVAVFDVDSVDAARSAARTVGTPMRVHWKIDTGMGRLGTRLDSVDTMRDALRAASDRLRVAGLFTHFASADDPSPDITRDQHDRFTAVVGQLREQFPDALLHCANSAALLRFPDTHHDMVRPGIVLYGYPPDGCAGVINVHAAMSVRALVTMVKQIGLGERVGYGGEWVAGRRSRIATVAAGYADGVDPRNCNRGSVLVGGSRCPIVGRVSMDQVTVDVTDAGDVRTGDVVTVMGSSGDAGVWADDIGRTIGTISYQVLCAVSARVPRIAVSATKEDR